MAPESRVLTLEQARADRRQSPSRLPPARRAAVLSTDPPWLHKAPTYRLLIAGAYKDFFGVGAVANALQRSPGSVRRLIAAGVLADTPYRSPGRAPYGQRRLWRRADVLALAARAEQLGVRGRRPQQWRGVTLSPPPAARH